jgi:hypothetical protein
LVSGEYRTDGKIILTRGETGDQQLEDVRTPIVTLLRNPEGETIYPEIAREPLHKSAARFFVE